MSGSASSPRGDESQCHHSPPVSGRWAQRVSAHGARREAHVGAGVAGRREHHLRLLGAVVWLVLAGCDREPPPGAQGEFDCDVVTSLPAGDAVGVAVSGQYDFTLSLKSCTGPKSNAFWISTCSLSGKSVPAVVLQWDGRLDVRLDYRKISPFPGLPERLLGGIWQGGRFDVGGCYDHGQISTTARLLGTAASAGFPATMKLNTRDPSDGLDCLAIYTITCRAATTTP